MKNQFSKSKYCRMWQCPKMLWMDKYKPEEKEDSADDSRMEAGTEVGKLARGLFNLLDPFQAGDYYNRAMGGSFSIKSVLTAIFPDDPELDYHNLEGVHNGSYDYFSENQRHARG